MLIHRAGRCSGGGGKGREGGGVQAERAVAAEVVQKVAAAAQTVVEAVVGLSQKMIFSWINSEINICNVAIPNQVSSIQHKHTFGSYVSNPIWDSLVRIKVVIKQ